MQWAGRVASRAGAVVRGLGVLLKDPDRKPLPTIARDVWECALREREVPYYYFAHLLYKRSAADVAAHVGSKRLVRIRRLVAPAGVPEHISDKLLFRERLLAHGLPHPVLLAHTDDRRVTFAGREVVLGSADDLARFLRQLLSASSTGSVFLKPVDGAVGRDCHRFGRGPSSDVEDAWAAMRGRRFIVQEGLAQHPALNAIYSNAVNTVRVHTLHERGKAEVLSTLLRVGRGGSIVDNISAGGIYIPLDADSGRLGPVGREFFWNGAGTFRRHPDSGYSFRDFRMPMFDELLDLSRRAALVFDDVFLGWDIAMTPEGPVIVEANKAFHIVMAQIAVGGFRNHPGFSRAFAGYL